MALQPEQKSPFQPHFYLLFFSRQDPLQHIRGRAAVSLGVARKASLSTSLTNLSLAASTKGRSKAVLIPVMLATTRPLRPDYPCRALSTVWTLIVISVQAGFSKSITEIPSSWAGQARRDRWERPTQGIQSGGDRVGGREGVGCRPGLWHTAMAPCLLTAALINLNSKTTPVLRDGGPGEENQFGPSG